MLFLALPLDGTNYLMQKDIGHLVSVSTSLVSVVMAGFYVRLRFRATKVRCIVYVTLVALMQFGIINSITHHSIERFPY